MFSKSCEYAIRATIFIASESTRGNKMGIKDIAQKIDSPVAFTAKILQNLVRHKIIRSTKGPTGGFEVSSESMKEIKLADIVRAIDGDSVYQGCALGLPTCSESSPCPAHNKFKHIREELKKMLTSTSLEELTQGVHIGTTFLKQEKPNINDIITNK